MKRLSGFSLMEMMIVLTIVAIVAAASAPMINKKMVTESSSESKWEYTDNSNLPIGYNIDGNQNATVNIGGVADSNAKNPRLFINTKTESSTRYPHITFSMNGANPMKFIADGTNSNIILSEADFPDKAKETIAIGKNAKAHSPKSIVIGHNATIKETTYDGYQLAIGNSAIVEGSMSCAIGAGSCAKASHATAYGYNAWADAEGAVAIGFQTNLSTGGGTAGKNSVAVGSNCNATNEGAIAIGASAKAYHDNSAAIGYNTRTWHNNDFVLGNANNTVVIPGDLLVEGRVVVNSQGGTILRQKDGRYVSFGDVDGNGTWHSHTVDARGYTLNNGVSLSTFKSDRRLKNVGKTFTAGLSEVKKLEVFNYTFKDDKDKTPRVGVMAQDLKKIFPDAVTKGEDGFLRIRMEDMFYALVNAIKEIDSILTGHDKRIKELEKQNQELLKRIEALEKVK